MYSTEAIYPVLLHASNANLFATFYLHFEAEEIFADRRIEIATFKSIFTLAALLPFLAVVEIEIP